jgi:hypothetical protein
MQVKQSLFLHCKNIEYAGWDNLSGLLPELVFLCVFARFGEKGQFENTVKYK